MTLAGDVFFVAKEFSNSVAKIFLSWPLKRSVSDRKPLVSANRDEEREQSTGLLLVANVK